MATPLQYMSPKLPGLGDVDWGRYVSALTDIGYDGYTCIEVEDKAFEKSLDDATSAIRLSAKDLRNFVLKVCKKLQLILDSKTGRSVAAKSRPACNRRRQRWKISESESSDMVSWAMSMRRC